MKSSVPDHEVSSGNVFADLGLSAPGELMAKAGLARRIAEITAQRGLTQAQAARILGTTQPKVSELFGGKLAGFSVERLIRFLNALDQDVEIRISPKARGRERATVRVLGRGR